MCNEAKLSHEKVDHPAYGWTGYAAAEVIHTTLEIMPASEHVLLDNITYSASSVPITLPRLCLAGFGFSRKNKALNHYCIVIKKGD